MSALLTILLQTYISYRILETKRACLSSLSTAPVSLGLPLEVLRSHSDTPHSVGLIWTSVGTVAETPT
jgi:hypothetical protein